MKWAQQKSSIWIWILYQIDYRPSKSADIWKSMPTWHKTATFTWNRAKENTYLHKTTNKTYITRRVDVKWQACKKNEQRWWTTSGQSVHPTNYAWQRKRHTEEGGLLEGRLRRYNFFQNRTRRKMPIDVNIIYMIV